MQIYAKNTNKNSWLEAGSCLFVFDEFCSLLFACTNYCRMHFIFNFTVRHFIACYVYGFISREFIFVHFHLLKILAWNPRTFLADFIEILPAMISQTTSIEVLYIHEAYIKLFTAYS